LVDMFMEKFVKNETLYKQYVTAWHTLANR
jgi:hypothetical protein